MIFIPACLQLTCFVNEWVAVVGVCYICVEPFNSLIHKFVFWSVGGPYFVNENPLCWLVWIFLVLYLNVASFIFKLFFLECQHGLLTKAERFVLLLYVQRVSLNDTKIFVLKTGGSYFFSFFADSSWGGIVRREEILLLRYSVCVCVCFLFCFCHFKKAINFNRVEEVIQCCAGNFDHWCPVFWLKHIDLTNW